MISVFTIALVYFPYGLRLQGRHRITYNAGRAVVNRAMIACSDRHLWTTLYLFIMLTLLYKDDLFIKL